MQLPKLTRAQIQDRCTPQSFTRGEEYFDIGMIDNPVLHDWTLASTCEGTEEYPYHVSVELMPTGIAAADCSCLYDWGGDCKHIVALLLTYAETPEVIYSLDTLLTALAEKPKETLLRVISELLKQSPEMVEVARFHADIPEEPEVEIEPIPPELSAYATVIEDVSDAEPASPTHTLTVADTAALISRIGDHQPDTAITLYQHVIEESVNAQKRDAYEEALEYLTALRDLYYDLGQEDQWTVYLEDLRKRHSRKRLLLQIIAEI